MEVLITKKYNLYSFAFTVFLLLVDYSAYYFYTDTYNIFSLNRATFDEIVSEVIKSIHNINTNSIFINMLTIFYILVNIVVIPAIIIFLFLRFELYYDKGKNELVVINIFLNKRSEIKITEKLDKAYIYKFRDGDGGWNKELILLENDEFSRIPYEIDSITKYIEHYFNVKIEETSSDPSKA